MERTILHTLDDTQSFAKDLSKRLNLGIQIGLIGGLGAGKTTLVKYLVEALGVSDPVSSPTYVLQHEYGLTTSPIHIDHWDLFRLSEPPQEILEPVADTAIRIIEWCDKFPAVMDQCDLLVHIKHKDKISEGEVGNNAIFDREVEVSWFSRRP